MTKIGLGKLLSTGVKWLSLTPAQQRKQQQFAHAVALTRTAKKARDVVRRLVGDTFTLRSRAFTLRGVQIKGASAADAIPQATLFGGPTYLTGHATDEVDKRPGPGADGFGIPILGEAARPSFERKIPKALRISTLAQQGLTGAFRNIRGRKAKKGASKPFIINIKDKKFIARSRPRKSSESKKRLDFLYVFEDFVDLEETYDFQDTALRTARDVYVDEYRKAYLSAIRGAR